jgi:phosphoribosylanthranilate isomerase
MTAIKICGIKTATDGLAALEAGADMLGFIFYRPVRRYVEPALAADIIAACRAKHRNWRAVGVFVDETAAEVDRIAELCKLDLVQLNGDETPTYASGLRSTAIRVLRPGPNPWTASRLDDAKRGYNVERFMVDSHVDGMYGGTGVAGDWQALTGLMDGSILAGGLTAANVAQAIELLKPWGVDVSSGVERDGAKDPDLIREFIAAVRAYDLAPARSVR